MKAIKLGFLLLATVLIISMLQIGLAFNLPPPFSFVNALFISLFLILIITRSGVVVWLAFLSHFVIELYSATIPYGVILLGATLSFLFIFWLYQEYISSRTWHGLFFLMLISLIFYRTIFIAFLALAANFSARFIISWKLLFVNFAWELGLTSAVALPFIVLFCRRSKVRLARVN